MNYSRFDHIGDSDSDEERELRNQSSSVTGQKNAKTTAVNSDGKENPSVTSSSLRQCRCMFCGEAMTLESEEAAVGHMAVCPALNEQLDSKDQFHIPSTLQEKLSIKPDK
jgi:hypothetical protein